LIDDVTDGTERSFSSSQHPERAPSHQHSLTFSLPSIRTSPDNRGPHHTPQTAAFRQSCEGEPGGRNRNKAA
jgi:hypothetical protein